MILYILFYQRSSPTEKGMKKIEAPVAFLHAIDALFTSANAAQ